MYKGAILPLLTYGAPVWNDTLKYKHNTQRYVRVQRLINLKIARAYRTTSAEAQCIRTGITPITLKLEEVVTRYTFRDMCYRKIRNSIVFVLSVPGCFSAIVWENFKRTGTVHLLVLCHLLATTFPDLTTSELFCITGKQKI